MRRLMLACLVVAGCHGTDGPAYRDDPLLRSKPFVQGSANRPALSLLARAEPVPPELPIVVADASLP